MDQTGSNLISDEIIIEIYHQILNFVFFFIKMDQNGSNMIKIEQIWSNLFKHFKTGSNLIKLLLTWSKLIKLAQTWSTGLVFVPFLIIIGRLFKLITSLLVSSIGGSLVTWNENFQSIKNNQFCHTIICMNITMLRCRICVLATKYFANKNIFQIFQES